MALGRDDVGGLESRTLTVGANQRDRSRPRAPTTAGSPAGRRPSTASRTPTTTATTTTGCLLEVERDTGTAQAAIVERYTYDVNGNRKTRRLDGGAVETATFDDEDRLTVRGTTAYGYDGAGFLTERGDNRFDYSARGELLSATVGATTVTYRYDALGRRDRPRAGRPDHAVPVRRSGEPGPGDGDALGGRGAHDLPLRRRRPPVRVRALRPTVLRRHRPGRDARQRRGQRRRRGGGQARTTTRSAT